MAARASRRLARQPAGGAGRVPSARANSSPWGWALAGAVVGLALATVLFAPARWLALAVKSATGGHVQMPDAQGTLWRGSARMLLAGGVGSQGSVALPGRVEWRLRPTWTGPNLTLNAACCMAEALRLQVQARAKGALVTMQNHRSNWPAAVLAGLGTPWNTVQAEGQLALATEGLSVEWAEGRWGLAGRLTLDATDMASRLSTLKPMGSYRLTIHGGSLNSLTLETLQGSLQLSGQGQWVGGRLRFDGAATALPEQQEALSNLLNIIGRREGARSVIKLG